MINLKRSYYFGMHSIYLILLLSFVMADDSIYLWDLGVEIKSKPQTVIKAKIKNVIENKKYAALTRRHVSPKFVNVELKHNDINSTTNSIKDFSTLNCFEQYSLGNKYFISGRYVEAIKLLEMVDFAQLSSNQKIHLMKLHTDALFSLGYYDRIFDILTENKAYDLNDELLFLLGMSSTELGNKKIALNAFNKIIENHPTSEYQNIAKLQVRVLKR
jgi:tetratricopeptide (TPR) repeat protein